MTKQELIKKLVETEKGMEKVIKTTVYTAILENLPAKNVSELANKLGISTPTLSKYLLVLKTLGAITIDENGITLKI